MEKVAVRSWIEELGIIPALRVRSEEDASFAAEALTRAGLSIVEIPWSVPGAEHIITHLARANPELAVGAGSVWDKETAQLALKAGASFLTSETFDREVAQLAAEMDCIYIQGTMSYNEVNAARAVCSHFIKIVPCSHIGGPDYIRDLKNAFPGIPLIAAGGVTQQTAQSYILAGAVALGIGEAIAPKEALRRRNADWISELARRFIEIVKTARSEIAAKQAQASISRR